VIHVRFTDVRPLCAMGRGWLGIIWHMLNGSRDGNEGLRKVSQPIGVSSYATPGLRRDIGSICSLIFVQFSSLTDAGITFILPYHWKPTRRPASCIMVHLPFRPPFFPSLLALQFSIPLGSFVPPPVSPGTRWKSVLVYISPSVPTSIYCVTHTIRRII